MAKKKHGASVRRKKSRKASKAAKRPTFIFRHIWSRNAEAHLIEQFNDGFQKIQARATIKGTKTGKPNFIKKDGSINKRSKAYRYATKDGRPSKRYAISKYLNKDWTRNKRYKKIPNDVLKELERIGVIYRKETSSVQTKQFSDLESALEWIDYVQEDYFSRAEEMGINSPSVLWQFENDPNDMSQTIDLDKSISQGLIIEKLVGWEFYLDQI